MKVTCKCTKTSEKSEFNIHGSVHRSMTQ